LYEAKVVQLLIFYTSNVSLVLAM